MDQLIRPLAAVCHHEDHVAPRFRLKTEALQPSPLVCNGSNMIVGHGKLLN